MFICPLGLLISFLRWLRCVHFPFMLHFLFWSNMYCRSNGLALLSHIANTEGTVTAHVQIILRDGPFSTNILLLFRIQRWRHISPICSVCVIHGLEHLQKCQEYWAVSLYDIPWFEIPLPLFPLPSLPPHFLKLAFQDRVLMCSPGWLGIHSHPTSASWALGQQWWLSTQSSVWVYLKFSHN